MRRFAVLVAIGLLLGSVAASVAAQDATAPTSSSEQGEISRKPITYSYDDLAAQNFEVDLSIGNSDS